MKKYKTIYADPPWAESGGGRIIRGAQKHYPLMRTSEIVALKDFINNISGENAHLYLWVTNNFLPDGLAVMSEWGFKYKTTVTWFKNRIGLGQYFRGITEHCLFGVRGSLPYKILDGKRQQGKTGFYAEKTIHSAKPDEMRSMIEKVSYPPFIELFARQSAPEWDHWGNSLIC